MKCKNKDIVVAFRSALDGMMGEGGVLVALSGGADSVALLTLMCEAASECGFYVSAAHVNHSIRGDEADRDEAFCKELCKKLGVELHVLKCDVPSLARESGMGLEECAREVRYGYFKKLLASDARLTYIATAHNADDNAESVILNMMRGAGLRGMCGIPPVRDSVIIRPLLGVSKADILEYVQECGCGYVTDSTNADEDYSRNYVRGSVMPMLSRLTPSPVDAMAKMTLNLRTDEDFISCEAERAYSSLVNGGRVSRQALASLHPALSMRILTRMYADVKTMDGAMLERTHVSAILELARGDTSRFSLDVPGGVKVVAEYDSLWFRRGEKEKRERPLVALSTGLNVLWDGECIIYLSEGRDREFEKTYSNVYKFFIQADISSAIINGKLYARTRRDGDTYTSGGITKKVKKMLSERHYSAEWRESLPMICDDDGIVWVPGFAARGKNKNNDNMKKLYAYFCKAEGKDE